MLLGSPGAARPRHTVLTGKGGASGRVILQPAFQVALLVILLVHKLVVLQRHKTGRETASQGVIKNHVKFTAFIFMYMASYILTFSASLPRSITQKV